MRRWGLPGPSPPCALYTNKGPPEKKAGGESSCAEHLGPVPSRVRSGNAGPRCLRGPGARPALLGQSGRWAGRLDWHAGGHGASQLQGWSPRPGLPPRRAPERTRGVFEQGSGLRGGSARGYPQKGRALINAPTRKYSGLSLTLLPGQRPGCTKYTTPFPAGRGPAARRGEGAPSRAPFARPPTPPRERAVRESEPREAPGRAPPDCLPGGGLGHQGAGRVHGVGGRGTRAALGPGRVRRSLPPPPPSFTFSALTHRPPTRAGGGQRRGPAD